MLGFFINDQMITYSEIKKIVAEHYVCSNGDFAVNREGQGPHFYIFASGGFYF